ncbi:conserved hypothetical protein, partial [Ricinus communis]
MLRSHAGDYAEYIRTATKIRCAPHETNRSGRQHAGRQRGLEQRQQVGRLLAQVVGLPTGRLGGAAVAPAAGDGQHAGRLAGLDVAQVVAGVPALARRQLQAAGRLQQRRRVRLRMGGGVAGNRAAARPRPICGSSGS